MKNFGSICRNQYMIDKIRFFNCFKKIFFITTIIFIFCIFSFSYAKEFSDVPATHWAYQYVNEMTNEGIMNGYDDDTFKPSAVIKGSEFLTIIDNLVCKNNESYKQELNKYVNRFNEINQYNNSQEEATKDLFPWYRGYYEFASEHKLLANNMNLDNVTKPLARRDAAFIVASSLSLFEIINRKYQKNETVFDRSLISYPDINENTDLLNDEVNAIILCTDFGIFTGNSEGNFQPNNTITRAEVAVVMSRFNKVIKEFGNGGNS